jgi:hypothetical protein
MVPSNNAQATECKEVFYLQQLSLNIQETLFKTPWGTVIVKNCDDEGKLMEFKSKTEYSKSEKSLWLNLQLKMFRDNGELFPVFCCPECPSMKGFQSLNTDCSPGQFLPMLCVHSKTVSFLVQDWDVIWDIDVDENDASHQVFCNRDTVAITLHEKEHKNCGFFLAAIMFDNKLYILYTVTKRQNIPICSGHSCLLSHCIHSKKYFETVNDEDYVQDFDPLSGTPIVPEDEDNADNLVAAEEANGEAQQEDNDMHEDGDDALVSDDGEQQNSESEE